MFNLTLLKILTFLNIFLSWTIFLTPNPVYAAFLLISVFLSSALFLIMINIKFLSFVIIILYAGAISILFLFIIFTLNLKEDKLQASSFLTKALTSVCLSKIFLSLVLNLYSDESLIPYSFNILKSINVSNFINNVSFEIETIGVLLYSHCTVIFLTVSFILFFIMIALVVLINALKKPKS